MPTVKIKMHFAAVAFMPTVTSVMRCAAVDHMSTTRFTMSATADQESATPAMPTVSDPMRFAVAPSMPAVNDELQKRRTAVNIPVPTVKKDILLSAIYIMPTVIVRMRCFGGSSFHADSKQFNAHSPRVLLRR